MNPELREKFMAMVENWKKSMAYHREQSKNRWLELEQKNEHIARCITLERCITETEALLEVPHWVLESSTVLNIPGRGFVVSVDGSLPIEIGHTVSLGEGGPLLDIVGTEKNRGAVVGLLVSPCTEEGRLVLEAHSTGDQSVARGRMDVF